MQSVWFLCLVVFSVAQHQNNTDPANHEVQQSHNQTEVHQNSTSVPVNGKRFKPLDTLTNPLTDFSSHLSNTKNGSSYTHRKYPSFLDMNPLLKRLVTTYFGYELVDGWAGRYKLHKDEKNWFDAKNVCEQEGANLLVINSHKEAEVMDSLIERSGTAMKYFWIGFHDLYEEGNYVNVFNESLNSTGYAEWGYKEPDARSTEDCGVFGQFSRSSTNKNGLGDWICSYNLPYICEEEMVVQQNSIPSEKENLSYDGYKFIPPLGYYKLHRKNVKWQEAVNVCEQEGGHLLIINSKEEEMVVRSLMDNFLNYYWLGVHDQYEEGKYVTIFNDTLESTGYMKWYPGMPSGRKAYNCLMYNNYQPYGLDDYNCEINCYFICEQEV